MKGWFISGNYPVHYEYGLSADTLDGKNVAYLRSRVGDPIGFGTLMQELDPANYLGQRVRLSALIKAEDVRGKAGLWMRVDGETQRERLAFDNMHDRPITGTTGWARYEVILDIAHKATTVCFGVLLQGAGQILLADFRFEVVPKEVPSTDTQSLHVHSTEPQNLDFSET